MFFLFKNQLKEWPISYEHYIAVFQWGEIQNYYRYIFKTCHKTKHYTVAYKVVCSRIGKVKWTAIIKLEVKSHKSVQIVLFFMTMDMELQHVYRHYIYLRHKINNLLTKIIKK